MLNDIDTHIYANEIRPYLPEKIFDAHTHLQTHRFYPQDNVSSPFSMQDDIDMPTLQMWWRQLFPDAQTSGLVLGFPAKQCDISSVNADLAEQVRPPHRFSILCSPRMSAKEVELAIQQYKPAGLKPYMCFVEREDFNNASIVELIPEDQIALADQYGLSITLHVAKPQGMGDADNLADITRLVKAYPRCHFILAHCGRCFISPNAEQMLASLPVAENLWIDTSAVCDPGVFLHLFSTYDLTRILFGTDLVSAVGFRGRYVRMGLSWDLVTADKLQRPGGQHIKATFAAYENLCALFCAARFCKLTDTQINDMFYANAQTLFHQIASDNRAGCN